MIEDALDAESESVSVWNQSMEQCTYRLWLERWWRSRRPQQTSTAAPPCAGRPAAPPSPAAYSPAAQCCNSS